MTTDDISLEAIPNMTTTRLLAILGYDEAIDEAIYDELAEREHDLADPSSALGCHQPA